MGYLRDLDDKHPAYKYMVLCIVAAIAGLIVLGVYAHSRTVIDPGVVQDAQSHCTAWIQKYEPADKNPLATCEAAAKDNIKAFTYRWSKGVGPT